MGTNLGARFAQLATAAIATSAFLVSSSNMASAEPVTDARGSANWAGVLAYPTDGNFTHVLAQWAEPKLECDAEAKSQFEPNLAIWAGLGTGRNDTDPLVQAGTLSECTKGTQEKHQPFYQIYPNEKGQITRLDKKAAAGDVMQAEVWAGRTSYQVLVRNVTKGWDTGRITIALDRIGRDTGATNARKRAEWVAERPGWGPFEGCASGLLASHKPIPAFDDKSTDEANDLVLRGRTEEPSTLEAWKVIGTPWEKERDKTLMEPESWVTNPEEGDATAWLKWRAHGCGLP